MSAEVSGLLFDARVSLQYLVQLVEEKTGERDHYDRNLIRVIDEYRARQGWAFDGFGGEAE